MEIHIMANWKQIMLRGAKLKSRIFRSRKIPSYLTENVTEDLIVLKNLVKVYDTGSIKVLGLKKINLTIKRGEFVAIMGKSGSGKSTLMNILGCLDRPSLGHYYLDGIDTASMSPNELSEIRNYKIGFVFQSFNLISRTSALKNVELPMTYARRGKKERRERAMELLKRVGLESRADHMPNELSGGQRQRVAIARAIAQAPPIILADEPTGNLDSKNGQNVAGLLKMTTEIWHRTLVMVTHNQELAQMADRVIRMQDGRITEN